MFVVLLFKCGSARFNPRSKTIGTLTVSEGQTTIQTRVNPMSCFTCLSYLIHWTIFHPSGCTSVTTSLKITLLTKTSPMNTRSIFNMHLMHWDIHHQKNWQEALQLYHNLYSYVSRWLPSLLLQTDVHGWLLTIVTAM